METLLKENGRLRKEIAAYQTALEAMEHRATKAEREAKGLRKKLSKILDAVLGLANEKAPELEVTR